MRAPKEPLKRLLWARQTIADCAVSQTRRQTQYEDRARWYTYGTNAGIAEANKVKPEIDTLSAFLYTGETTRFSADLPPGADPDDIKRAPIGAEDLARCEPVYEELPGWSDSTVGISSRSELPANALAYLARIEDECRVRVDMISTGPDREETIVLRHPFA